MRIERIEGGRVTGNPKLYSNGKYKCHPDGNSKIHKWCATLEEVADYLRTNPGSGVRMDPGGGKISENIFIDGVPR
ncbi:hypothetical protein [Tritonibacter mobilis]|uniref:hypothetical protein n=1 Tax=Tritonibacter mobilis TaxID=379347 RepID=UPI001CD93558|nr:hypothetical protein [Tritonibacter mobilis]MCA2009119.1 hypothetical protein [Tritonibacter mobilis]